MKHVVRGGGRLMVVASMALVGGAACASAGVMSPGAQPRATTSYQGVPGFDTRVYPGDSALARWRRESPYRWVGYYLPAPCHTDSSWVGRRAVLQRLGWGSAVVFTGEQDWGAAATVHGPSVKDTTAAAAAAAPRCTRANLTAEQGRRDAAAADSAMAAEGFAGGSPVYLDVERVDSVSTPMATYVQAWVGALLERGRYLPALYAHARNADALHAVQSREYQRRSVAATPRFWVSGGATPFDVHAMPAASGVAYANVWQGASNITEQWGGTSLRIDVNVADAASPSAPTSGEAPAASGAGGQGR